MIPHRQFPLIVIFVVLIHSFLSACPPQPPLKGVSDGIASGNVGETLTFSGLNTFYCPDGGQIAEYRWVLPPQSYHAEGDNTSELRCKFSPSGTYEVELHVKCSHGRWNTEHPNYPSSNRYVCHVTVLPVAGPWYVKPDGSDANTGLSVQDAFRSIQIAIDSAVSGQAIIVQSGSSENQAIYHEQLDLKGKSLTIRSDDPDNWQAVENTIIDAGQRGTAILYRGNESGVLKGFTIPDGAPAGDGLLLHLKFDETAGTTAADASGKERHGTLDNFPADDTPWTRGVFGGALNFDGIDDYIQIDGYPGIAGKVSRTCSAWIKTDSANDHQMIMSWGKSEAGKAWGVFVRSDGKLGVFLFGGDFSGTSTVNDGQWHHITAVLDDTDGVLQTSDIRIYVNGVQEQVTRLQGTDPGPAINTSHDMPVTIGVRNYNGFPYDWTYKFHFNGLLDDVRIYSRALSDVEIQQQIWGGPIAHWKLDNNLEDSSLSASYNGIWSGTADYTDGYHGQAITLDGSSYVEIPGFKGITGGDSRTCTAWIRTTGVSGEIVSWGPDTVGNKWILRINQDGTLRAEVNSGYIYGTTVLTDGNWHHIAVTLLDDGSPDINEAKLYVNGQLESIGASLAQGVNTGDSVDVRIGVHYSLLRYFEGEIDDVRIYSRALTASEIHELADRKPRLVAHWKLDGNAQDSSGYAHDGDLENNPSFSGGIAGQSLELNGTDQYVAIPHHPRLKPQFPLTLSAWINPASSGTNGRIISSDYPNSSNYYSGISLRLAADNKVVIAYGDGTAIAPSGRGTKEGTTTLQPHRWYHVVGIIRGPQDMSIYINGQDDGGEYTGTSTRPIYYQGNEVLIGNNIEKDRGFNGTIDDVRMYNYGLCRVEVLSLYQLRFSDGGGIRGHGASPAVERSSLKDNQSQVNGAAISGLDGMVHNCIFIRNTSSGFGGAISDSLATIENCTFVNNAATSGGALYVCNGQLLNNILWGNIPNQLDNCSSIAYSCIQGWTQGGMGNISANPHFWNLPENNYRLLLSSPCIDAGHPESGFDAEPAPNGGRINLGVYGNTEDAAITVEDRERWDTSGDGIPDWWAIEYGFDPHATIADDDSDGDGFVNLTEYLHGTNPTMHDNQMPTAEIYVQPGGLTIQRAIDHSIDGDAVILATGTYTGQGNRDIDFNGKAITVRSIAPNDPDVVAATIIDCEGTAESPHRGFVFQCGEGTHSVLSGLTIQNGYAPEAPWGNSWYSSGGAIFIKGNSKEDRCSPTVRNCVIKDNVSAYWGGGIRGQYSNAVIENCIFVNNTASSTGGGVYMIVSDYLIRNCHFLENEAGGSGGALWAQGSISTIEDCVIERNRAQKNGGGFKFNTDPYPLAEQKAIVAGCKFYGNITEAIDVGIQGGGALDFSLPTAIAANCVFAGNVSGNLGGAIRSIDSGEDTDITIVNCTFSDNSAVTGASISVVGAEVNSVEFGLYNSIIWNTNCMSIPEISIRQGDLTVSHCNVIDGLGAVFIDDPNLTSLNWPGDTNFSFDPLFARRPSPGADGVWGTEDDDYGDLRLYNTCSPCIDAGNNDWLPADFTEDMDGNPRFRDPDDEFGQGFESGDSHGMQVLVVIVVPEPEPRVDMGAYEFQNFNQLQPPYAADDPTLCESPIPCGSLPIEIFVLSNDCNPDGGDLWVSSVSDPSYGTVDICTQGTSVIYTPPSTNGLASFTYTAINSFGLESNPATVNIYVEHENALPEAVIEHITDTFVCNDYERALILFDGSGSCDFDGHIEQYQWFLNDAEIGDGNVTFQKWVPVGSHTVKLIVWDNLWASDSIEKGFNISVAHGMPQAKNTTIDSITDGDLDGVIDGIEPVGFQGNQSTGAIAMYYWYVNDKPVSSSFGPNTTQLLGVGTHAVRLMVVDICGRVSYDDTEVTVLPAGLDPEIDAGPEKDVAPGQTVTLEGRVIRGEFARYEWHVLITPPGGFVQIPDDSILKPEITVADAITGVYAFKLIGKDEGGNELDSDITLINVQHSPGTNNPPVVRAWIGDNQDGAEETIELNQVGTTDRFEGLLDLNGDIADDGQPFGTLTGRWTRLSGPVGGVTFEPILSQCSNRCAMLVMPQTTATFTKDGDYLLALMGDDGARSTYRVVHVTAYSGRKPYVYAGEHKFKVLKGDSVSVSMSDASVVWRAADSGDRTIQWSCISQPGGSTCNFTGEQTIENPTVTFNTAGSYQLELTATDPHLQDGTASHTVWVTILEDELPPEAADEKKVYAAGSRNDQDEGARVFRRVFGKDDRWTAISAGKPGFDEAAVLSLCECYGSLFAGTMGSNDNPGHVYQYLDSSDEWIRISDWTNVLDANGNTISVDVTTVYCLVEYDQQLYAGTNEPDRLLRYKQKQNGQWGWEAIDVEGHSSGIRAMRVWQNKLFLDAGKSSDLGYFDSTHGWVIVNK